MAGLLITLVFLDTAITGYLLARTFTYGSVIKQLSNECQSMLYEIGNLQKQVYKVNTDA